MDLNSENGHKKHNWSKEVKPHLIISYRLNTKSLMFDVPTFKRNNSSSLRGIFCEEAETY